MREIRRGAAASGLVLLNGFQIVFQLNYGSPGERASAFAAAALDAKHFAPDGHVTRAVGCNITSVTNSFDDAVGWEFSAGALADRRQVRGRYLEHVGDWSVPFPVRSVALSTMLGKQKLP